MRLQTNQPVLIINDDLVQLRLLGAILEKDGLAVQACQSAEEGLAFLETHGPPRVLVTDLHMPGIDGWRFCRLLRSPDYAAFNHVPILVVSATFAGDHAREVTRNLGANAFLSLPCPAGVFRETVRDLLSGKIPHLLPQVLIIEDSPTLARLLAKTFGEHGYSAAGARTGEEGRRLFQELTPELVILDYHLPGVKGDVLLQEFKAASWYPAVLMITTDLNHGLATRFMRLGANGYVRKPFDPNFLVELGDKVRRERALLRVEGILEARTLELRESHAKLTESEARLKESEEKYRLLVASLPSVVFTAYPDGRIDFYDDKILEVTGFSPQEFAGPARRWRDLILDEDRPGARQAFIQALRTDRTYIREYRLRTRSDGILWIQERSRIFLDDQGEVASISGILCDISESKRLEEERLKVDKLESLGTLAGGIAHDFNNLLTAMLGNINLASLTADLSGPVQEHLAAAEQACLRARALSQQLLTFARGGAPVKKVMAAPPLIREAASLALAGSRCRARFSLAEDLWPLEVDPDQLSQTLNNIFLNADQAMPNGGTITVSARNVLVGERGDLPLIPGPYVAIAVIDAGMGIDPSHQPRIFDPYFSTKQKGSGLGLATSFSILKKHGGHLTVSSVLGEGATFTLYLPAASRLPGPETVGENLPVNGRGKILVMDDEPLVREIAGRMLLYLGYEVDCAAHGQEALEKFFQAYNSRAPFDALILDLTVPGGLGGKETLERIRPVDSRVRAIMSSGYADDPLMTAFADYGFQGVMKKPYRVKDMSEVLATVLGE